MVEVILSAIRPVQLLAGKVLGVGLLGLLQIGADRRRSGWRSRCPSGAITLPSSTAETVVLVLVYFVLGYLFYGCAFAGTASLVSRQEDIQSTTAPLLVIAIGSYIATNAALGNPERQPGDDRHLPAADGADGRPRPRRPGRAAGLASWRSRCS